MPSLEETLLVFTDLDGTLLDFHTLDWQPAAPWLAKLRDKQIPVILCSSKTTAGMQDMQQELGLGGLPYIAENGAVIQPDVRWENAARFISAKKHDDIWQFLAQVRQDLHLKFTTFDDVDDRVVAEWTG
ncbi:HAD-IIB family hydrolase, partial [Enterobacter hormaechei]